MHKGPHFDATGSVSGTSETLDRETWAAALEELLLMDAAKSEFSEFLPK